MHELVPAVAEGGGPVPTKKPGRFGIVFWWPFLVRSSFLVFLLVPVFFVRFFGMCFLMFQSHMSCQENYTWMRREADPKGAQLAVEKPHEYSATW